MWTRTGNYLYLAPEIYQGGGYNESVDLWAVGMILY
jgi:calcium-dependent protein kinase